MGASSSKKKKNKKYKLGQIPQDEETNAFSIHITNIKNIVSDIQNKINNANLSQMKSDIAFIKSEMADCKNLLLSLIGNKPPNFNIPKIESNYELKNLNQNESNQILNKFNENLNYSEFSNNKNSINNINNSNNIISENNINNINNINNSNNNINLKNNNNKNNINNNNNNNNFNINNNAIKNFNNMIQIGNSNINDNITMKNADPNGKTVVISKNGQNFSIKINGNTTLEQFKSLAKNHFIINNNTIIYYFNNFAVKKLIQNEFDFKTSLTQNVVKYYFSDEISINFGNNNNNLIPNLNMPKLCINSGNNNNLIPNLNMPKLCITSGNNNNNINNNIQIKQAINPSPNNPISIGFYNMNNNNNMNNINVKNINNQKPNNNNNNNILISNIPENNFLKIVDGEDSIDQYKKEVKDVMNHFSSLAFIPSDIKVNDFINSAVYLSYMMKKINVIEQMKYPFKFHDSKEKSKYPGLISSQFGENEKIFILSLIKNILEEKGINVSIYKKAEDMDNLDGACLQYLFNGFTEKKKYEINFSLEPEKTVVLLQKGNDLDNFVNEWELKISNHLKLDKSEITLTNPKEKQGFCLDLVYNGGNIQYNKLKDFNEIKNVEEESLIEGCQLNIGIFDENHNNQDPGWGINETRGGEKYIPPIGWYGYGLKVAGKYDNGDNTWIEYVDHEGVFAVAYFGLSNIYGNKKNLSHFLSEITSQETLKVGYEQTYKNDINIKEKSKNEYKQCGNGVYLFQDPKIAENTASIIEIGGVRYKVLLMCRVNPKKIRQPQGFPNCWILNPTPSEVRPYRILIKKIFMSPMAGASQYEIKTFSSTPEYYKDIIKKKDTSFFKKNHSLMNNDDFVIKLYTSNEYTYINNYLRSGTIDKLSPYTENEIKSWAWCLHSALTSKKSNVSNGSIYYRGINRKFPDELGIGSKFIFSEFTSVSEDKYVALAFAAHGTLLIIRIENNNNSHYYCYNISKMSHFQNEREILITSNCTFHITKKNENKKDSIDEIYLTCEGYKADGTS